MEGNISIDILSETWSTLTQSKNGEEKKLAIGCDGMSKFKFQSTLEYQIDEICRRINAEECAYNFGPLLYYNVAKNSGGKRRIYIPRIKDQLVLKWMHNELNKKAAERGISLTTQSPFKSTIAFRKEILNRKNPYVIRTDILSYFDTIPRNRVIALAASLDIHPKCLQLLQKWSDGLIGRPMKYAGKLHDCSIVGLPQGLSLSAALAELWGHHLIAELKKYSDAPVFRYVDDISIITNSEEEAFSILGILKQVVIEFGLQLSDKKTEISALREGVSWLGFKHFEDSINANPERVEKWMNQLFSIRKKAMLHLAQNPELDKSEGIKYFVSYVRAELKGKTSHKPRWYSLTKDIGIWKKIDSQLASHWVTLHHQLKIPLPEKKPFPSLHKIMKGRALQF
jgi:hypothetical protein